VGAGATCTDTYGIYAEEGFEFKKIVWCYFFALWVRANVQSKIWAQGRKKRSARIPSDSQQKYGRKTTQHVNSVAVVKSPIDDDRRHR
jgi:hypothetical protein